MNALLPILVVLFFSSSVCAGETSAVDATKHFDLTHHFVGFLSIIFTVLAYVTAMAEDVIELRKSKPMVLGAAVSGLPFAFITRLMVKVKLPRSPLKAICWLTSNCCCLSWSP